MENKKRITEGSLVTYKGLTCEVTYSSVNYVNLRALGFDEVFQGIHITKIN